MLKTRRCKFISLAYPYVLQNSGFDTFAINRLKLQKLIKITLACADSLNLIYDANGNLVTGDGFYR